jgi:methionyl aminopeptidase
MAITYKTPDDIAKLRISGRLAADVLAMIGEHVKAGVSTDELDALCNDYIVNTQKSIPANVGYLGFPKTVCTSVNQVVCHGIPNRSEILKDGDIINIDVAIIKDGYFGDTSRMYCVGQPSTVARQLIDTTYEAMLAGIREVKPGATLGDVGYAIQKIAQRDGFSIVRDYCGHGIGKVYHALRSAGAGRASEAGHGLHDRTDDQRGPRRHRGAARRLDGGHQRPLPVRAMGTHDRRDRRGL